MKTCLYSIYDRKSGNYGTPFSSYNDDTAQRDFLGFCGEVANKYLADDLELYKVGQFESSSGEVFSVDNKPEFLCGYDGFRTESSG